MGEPVMSTASPTALRCAPPRRMSESPAFDRITPRQQRTWRLKALGDSVDAMTSRLAQKLVGTLNESGRGPRFERVRESGGRKKFCDDRALIHVALKVDVVPVGELRGLTSAVTHNGTSKRRLVTGPESPLPLSWSARDATIDSSVAMSCRSEESGVSMAGGQFAGALYWRSCARQPVSASVAREVSTREPYATPVPPRDATLVADGTTLGRARSTRVFSHAAPGATPCGCSPSPCDRDIPVML